MIEGLRKVVLNNYYIYPTLYKLNTFNKILIWYIERDKNKYRVIRGQLEGKLIVSNWIECLNNKNILSIKQAEKECVSKYTQKLNKEGYILNKKLLNNNE